ncbi:MAG: winged helix-turn-helix transcriptional regulator [Thermoplasmata archaeon]
MAREILELETRRQIFDLVVENPGLHLREIQRRLNMSVTLADHHLRILEKEGLLTVLEEGGYKRFYPSPRAARPIPLSPEDKKGLALLRQEGPLLIVLHILSHGPIRHGELQERTGLPPSTVSYHLGKLMKSGVVARAPREEGRTYGVLDPQRIALLITAYRPAEEDFIDRFADLWRKLF